MSLIAKLRQKIAEHGPVFLVTWIVKNLVYSSRDTLLLTRELRPFTKRARESNLFEVRPFTHNDLAAARTYFQSKAAHFEEFLDEGIFALGAFHRETGDLIGINFYTPTDYYDRHLYHHRFRVKEGEVYQFAAEVVSQFRKVPVMVTILNEAVDYWSAKGFKKFLSATDVKNTTSVKFHFNCGYEEIGQALKTRQIFRCFNLASPYVYSDNRFDHLRERYLAREKRAAK